MQSYPCPKCKSSLEIQRTYEGMFLVSCPGCHIDDMIAGSGSIDEAVLDFGCRLDSGEAGKDEMGKMVRDPDQIRAMVGEEKIGALTRRVLDTKKDYVAHYTRIKRPGPETGQSVSALGLEAGIVSCLAESGIEKLYRFQEEAAGHIMDGRSVIIEAPTASGKTEAFAIPIIQKLTTERHSLALFVYPTKALARDQHPKILALARSAGMDAAVFDGDTNPAGRTRILDSPPKIIITNFDVIHYHLLHRTRFSQLLARAAFLVADETHAYSGIFGSNVHHIIKRLKRIAGRMQFVASSATLHDSKAFCERLFGEEMTLVRGSGGGGDTDFVMLFPSLRTQRALIVDLAKKLTAGRHKTMVFSNSHRGSELVAIQARRQGVDIRVHRAGLTARYRSSVERAFRGGSLGAISCTPTLELGIDVGSVDGVISSTIPVNRLMQRAGRAARKGQRGYAFLALGNDPISQYYRNHPADYFEDAERAYIDPENPLVAEFQMLAMASDAPILEGESKGCAVITRHVSEGNMVLRGGRYHPTIQGGRLLSDYSIRGIGGSIDIMLDGTRVGDRILPIALEELHKDAVYFLAGVRYKVKEFDYPRKRTAILGRIPQSHPYYTKALTEEWPTIQETYESRTVFGMDVSFCKIRIRKSVHGYANIELGQEAARGERVSLERPLEYNFVTKGVVFCAPRPESQASLAKDASYVEASGYHAAEHVVIEGSNMITGGASQDLGGISVGTSGMIFVYDGAIGGSGASRALYDRLEAALRRGASIVGECPCEAESGCPRCTLSYRCGNNNEFLHKAAALEIFERILRGERTALVEPDEADRPLV